MTENLHDRVAGVLAREMYLANKQTENVVVYEAWWDALPQEQQDRWLRRAERIADALLPLLERLEREAAARAWDECNAANHSTVCREHGTPHPDNPYRADGTTEGAEARLRSYSGPIEESGTDDDLNLD